MYRDGITSGVFAYERAVGVFDYDSAFDVLLSDGLINGLGLRMSWLFELYNLSIGDIIDAKLELKLLGEGILFVKVAKDCDVDMVKRVDVEALERVNAMHHSVIGKQKHGWDVRLVFGLIYSDRHDKGPRFA